MRKSQNSTFPMMSHSHKRKKDVTMEGTKTNKRNKRTKQSESRFTHMIRLGVAQKNFDFIRICKNDTLQIVRNFFNDENASTHLRGNTTNFRKFMKKCKSLGMQRLVLFSILDSAPNSYYVLKKMGKLLPFILKECYHYFKHYQKPQNIAEFLWDLYRMEPPPFNRVRVCDKWVSKERQIMQDHLPDNFICLNNYKLERWHSILRCNCYSKRSIYSTHPVSGDSLRLYHANMANEIRHLRILLKNQAHDATIKDLLNGLCKKHNSSVINELKLISPLSDVIDVIHIVASYLAISF
jgi:hypothetical protein